MRTNRLPNHLSVLALAVLSSTFATTARADLLLDTWDGSVTATSRAAGDGCGALVTVGAKDVKLSIMKARLDLSADGIVKFVIFSHPAHVLLHSNTVNLADTGMSWQQTFLNFTLEAGETYDVGVIADVAADYQFDTSNSSGSGIDSTATNPDFLTFAAPTVNAHGSSDCAVQLDGLLCGDMCTPGDPIPFGCNECVQIVCLYAEDPISYCCVNSWDSFCVSMVTTDCGIPDCLPGGVSACGDGYVTTGEQCEVGPAHPDCCVSCQLEPALTPCGDDANVCTDDYCNATGTCLHVNINCNDSNPCTTDTCDAIDGCQNTPVTDGTACASDGNVCTADQCIAGSCQNTPLTDGSACTSDSNICTADECIGGACSHPPVPDGTPCEPDASMCTFDECQGGVCTHGYVSVGTCYASSGGIVSVVDPPDPGDPRAKVAWNWIGGDAFDSGDLGDPLTDTTYGLCIYDDQNPSLTLNLVEIEIQPSGAFWISKGSKGLLYKDKDGTAGGVKKMSIKTGTQGRTKLKISAGGTNLALPGPVGATYFTQNPHVTVRLVNDAGSCWTSEFSVDDTGFNGPTGFKAAAKD